MPELNELPNAPTGDVSDDDLVLIYDNGATSNKSRQATRGAFLSGVARNGQPITPASVASTGAVTAPSGAIDSLTVATGLTVGATLQRLLTATGTLTIPAIANGTEGAATFTLNGAVVGDHVTLQLPASFPAGLFLSRALVTTANTVTAYFYNATGSSIAGAGYGVRIFGQRWDGASVPGAVAPAAFTAGQWTLANSPSAGGNTLTVNLTALPFDGGSPITALQFRRNGGSATALSGGTTTGTRNITVTATTAADIQVRAVNAVDANPNNWSDIKTQTPTVLVTGTQAARQGSVEFVYSGDPLITGNSFDGAAFIVVPVGGSVTMTAVTPAVTTIVQSATTYTINGVGVNLLRDAAHPFDQRQPDNWNAGAMATFPQLLSDGDIVLKQISSTTTTPGTIRNGTGQEFAVCHIIDQPTYNTLQAQGGIANHLSPAPFGWAGRETSEWRRVDIDALFAARPNGGTGLSLAAVELPNDANISIPETVARLDRFNAGLISRTATGVTGSYETASIQNYAGTGGNYGATMVEAFRRVYLGFIGNRPRSEIEPAIRRFVALGSWFYDQEVGCGNTVYDPDGGHHLFMLVPMLLGLMATGRAASIPALSTVTNQNQLKGFVEMTSGNLARLVKHTNATTEPFTYRERDIDSIVGSQINLTNISGDQPYYRNFYGLECRRASDNAFMGIVDRKTAADATQNFVTLDRDPIGLLDTDRVYFSAPSGWLAEGDYVWSVNGSMKGMTPSPRPTYGNLNGWAAECLFERALGLYSDQFEPMEVLTKRRAYEVDARPSVMAGAGGTILGFTAFGEAYVSDNPVEVDNSRFTKTFWNAHAASLGLGNSPIPVNTAVPAPTGTLMVGQTLTLGTGTWSNTPTSFALVLSNGGTATGSGTGPFTYVVPQSLAGQPFSYTVAATNASGTSAPVSSVPTASILLDHDVFWAMDSLTNVTRTGASSVNATSTLALAAGSGLIEAPLEGSTAFTIRRALFAWPGGINAGATGRAAIRATDLFMVGIETPKVGGVYNPLLGSPGAMRFSAFGSYQQFIPPLTAFGGAPVGWFGKRYHNARASSIHLSAWGGQDITNLAAGNVTMDVSLSGVSPSGLGTVTFGPIYRVITPHKPIFVFTFDDWNEEHRTVTKAMFDSRGLVGSAYAVISEIGQAGRLSQAQAIELRNGGWSINLDGHYTGWPITVGTTVEAAIDAMDANGLELVSRGMSSLQDIKHICYSFNGYQYSSISTTAAAITANANNTNVLTLSSGTFFTSARPAAGAYVKGSSVPAGTRVVSMTSTTVTLNNVIPVTGPVSVRFTGAVTGPAVGLNFVAAGGTPVVTSIVTNAIVPGMIMVGRGVPANTTVLSVDIEASTATGQITVSNNVAASGANGYASFHLPDGEWRMGNFLKRAVERGYLSGRNTGSIGAGVSTQFGLAPGLAMTLDSINAEPGGTDQAARELARDQAIATATRCLRDCNDALFYSHGIGEQILKADIYDYVAGRVAANEAENMNLTNWYETIRRRRGP